MVVPASHLNEGGLGVFLAELGVDGMSHSGLTDEKRRCRE